MGNANLLEVARGAIGERLDYELSKVVDNIADLIDEHIYVRY